MIDKADIRATYTLKYGTLYVGNPIDHQIRRDWYQSDEGESGYDRIHTAGRADISNVHSGYNSKCSWCWLGYGHTEDLHNVRISESA